MQIQLVNHCKIGQGFQGWKAILFFHYAGYLLLNMLKINLYIFFNIKKSSKQK